MMRRFSLGSRGNCVTEPKDALKVEWTRSGRAGDCPGQGRTIPSGVEFAYLRASLRQVTFPGLPIGVLLSDLNSLSALQVGKQVPHTPANGTDEKPQFSLACLMP